MGVRSSKPVGGFLITLDALGTIVKFRKPIAVQYAEVAKECGLKTNISQEALQQSFKDAFKVHSKRYPNYGKNELSGPEEWWKGLVEKSFEPLIGVEKAPANLGSRMYEHFSSSAAYELYPDVKPLMDSVRHLKRQYSDPEGPMIICGVISNSDPRIKDVLQSLGLRAGYTEAITGDFRSSRRASDQAFEDAQERGSNQIRSPYYSLYDQKNDFDFVATSYMSGYEKPEDMAFKYAKMLAAPLPLSRREQTLGEPSGAISGISQLMQQALAARAQTRRMFWIHIGDSVEQDYHGALNAGGEALHLAREGEVEPVKDVQTVLTLDEAATIINLLVQERIHLKVS